ncbi:hypothetical protein FVR03_14750 [Pontibacter qinzhouensis]|uniref:Uncharacterized protein n=1 Tax=Pontibacter qinzhouensis TaxID=2603253 RepID=A0A5C8JLS4_9BACT|nr:hypothetical protein FVR03_14750 [Pontibacter qinzhouensis]
MLLTVLILTLLASPACQRKGLKCPKPSKSSATIGGPGGKSIEGVKVQTDKNGLVKKKKFF